MTKPGELRLVTRAAGLFASDRACLALASATDAIALTTDIKWSDVDVGVTVEQLRLPRRRS